MTDEPYRWLEAIANRREYIRDQLRQATPVFAVSRPEGILLMGVGSGQSKVFEIHDRLALAALGHPVDIERVRQTAIESAHLEGFTRDPADVTARRLLNFSICPLLKSSFEQIFAAPLLVESLVVEVAPEPAGDQLARVGFDGNLRFCSGGLAVAHSSSVDEPLAHDWLSRELQSLTSLSDVLQHLMAAWKVLTSGKPFAAPSTQPSDLHPPEGRTLEVALLDRNTSARARFRPLEAHHWS